MRAAVAFSRLTQSPALAAVILTVVALCTGCATSEQWIERRPADQAYAARLLWSRDGRAALSDATLAVAQPRGLDPTKPDQRAKLLELLEQEAHSTLAPDLEFALAELAATEADSLVKDDPDAAVGFYAESLVHGYRALAADERQRIPGTTRRYNDSLKALLRLLRERDQVKPGALVPLPLTHGACSVAIELHSQRWTEADFQSFEFASDFQVLALRNHYHTTGIGTPLIAIRHHPDRDQPQDKFYPRKLCYPLTAVARAESYEPTPARPEGGVRLVLELHDTTDHKTFQLAGRRAPLETDLTTPLAYYLDQPDLQDRDVSTIGLLKPDSVKQQEGLYLLEPYDPNRIPVVMVHGLWSSPATWMEMFNDLRSDPRVRSRYQFWFYLYPTGHPFWVSAAQMRKDLAELRQTVDPTHTAYALDQTVLVGHSMGGLLSRLQTVDSGQDFWRIVTDREFKELDADPEVRQYMSNLFFFQPNPSVQRVVTIGTPHRGSMFANGFTQWVGAKLIAFPMQTMARQQELFRRNPGFFRPQIAARVMTSIDSLSPESPMLPALLAAKSGPWVRYHNVVGDEPRSAFTSWFTTRGDGVVSLDSARLDDLPQLASQVVVPEDHVMLHRHPQTIAEVRRVLMEHVATLDPQGYAQHAAEIRTLPPVIDQQPVRLASGVLESVR
ncbi:esterase/lipase family protein [Botrimarina mediterranea]|uniref:Alpha/beta hydrolase family protein n=1 Tax=Botrimarina mediterranea TaxID=2528022 RepID=A0A518K6T2_9BACT|nr:alpha/beta fold hydrolase [Botrimarina mediterranea]QDV73494.1 Alpha/beta hydrolase family protein [Botrimarina mediterranea]